jgi:hypothetical protein
LTPESDHVGLERTHRRWILINAVAVAAVANLAICAAIAWLSSLGRPDVPLWAVPLVGGPSMIVDTLGTLFLLPFITCLIVTAAVGYELRRGTLTPLGGAARARYGGPAMLARGRVSRGLTLGLLCVVVLGPGAIALLYLAEANHLAVADFVLYKAVLGVGLGAIVTPVIALLAMAEASAPKPQ